MIVHLLIYLLFLFLLGYKYQDIIYILIKVDNTALSTKLLLWHISLGIILTIVTFLFFFYSPFPSIENDYDNKVFPHNLVPFPVLAL